MEAKQKILEMISNGEIKIDNTGGAKCIHFLENGESRSRIYVQHDSSADTILRAIDTIKRVKMRGKKEKEI